MVELCEELYEELYEDSGQKYKWQREEKKRVRSLEKLKRQSKKQKGNVGSINSHKTFYVVELISNDKEYLYEVPANKYIGHPDEYKEIKQMCVDKYGVGVRIINIATK